MNLMNYKKWYEFMLLTLSSLSLQQLSQRRHSSIYHQWWILIEEEEEE